MSDVFTNDPIAIKKAQRLLSILNYGILPDTGVLDTPTKEAIKKARADLGLPMSSNVDDALLEALSKEYATRGLKQVALYGGLGFVAVLGGMYLYDRYKNSARNS